MGKFFDEQADQSQVKTAIVTKYFWAWAKIITAVQKKHGGDRIAYIDLFAGPGRYKDGAKSTPLLILEQAIADPVFRDKLVVVFNDKDAENTSTLKQEIAKLDGLQTLKHEPGIYTNEVGEEIVKMFEQWNLVPTLFFVDPWGYKGLSLRLINSVLKNWGCDCIFFFNYNRINMGLGNDAVKHHMEALFGADKAPQMSAKLETLDPIQRELCVVEELCKALKDMGGKYTLPFRFKNAQGNRTSHHLIFVSKDQLGYEVMKDIMAKESSIAEQGVPTFEYNPADARQPFLFELARPLDDLEGMLCNEFAGRTMTMLKVFQAHHIDRCYIKKNYKDVLLKLEMDGKIKADPPRAKRKKNTFADHVRVTFPKKEAAS
jgi:three-Cys-motif partner protein